MKKVFQPLAFAIAALATFAASAFDTPYLTFRSASSFSLSATKRWDGTLQKATGNPTDEASWSDWTGSSISAGLSGGQYYIYLRGKDNTHINNTTSSPFTLSGATADIYCDGDIETLRDYEGNPPNMAQYCYAALFNGWTRLVSPPVMSATTLAVDCYRNMFEGCTALKSIPTLSATTVPDRGYYYMFKGCTSLEINGTLPGVEWRLPEGVTGGSIWNYNMFAETGGSFTGNPVANTPYYVASALPAGEIYQIAGKGTLDLALVGFSVNVDLSPTVKNGTAPYTFTLASGTLPLGLNVSGSTLAGTPTTAGNYSFSLSVTDAESHTLASAAYTMQVVQPTIVATTFIGADGSSITTNCITLTTAMTTLNQFWYVASGTLNFGTGGITVSGDVNLVLADDASMTVQGASKKAGVNVATGNSLTIYGQTAGTGALNASGNSSDGFELGGAGIGGNDKENAGTVTINGGTINATGSQYTAAGIGGGKSGNGGTVTINGGTVTATGGIWYGAGIGGGQGGNGGNVTINGGTVTATAGSQSAGTANAATGIGRGYGYGPTAGTLTVGPSMSVKAGSTANPTEEIGRGGTITIGTQQYFFVETAGLVLETSAFAAYANESKNWNLADTISGGTTPYSFTPVVGFEPPSGLSLSGTTLSGSVAAADTYTIKYTVTDSSATPLVLEAVYTLTVTAPDPITETQTSLSATVGKSKSFTLADTISGGVPSYTFALASGSNAPDGFSLTDGVLSGTAASAVASYSFTVVVTDALGTTKNVTYTFTAVESTGFTDDDPEEPASGDSVDCRTADGVVRSRTCNLLTSSSTVWEDSWYYVAPNTTLSIAGVRVNGKVSLILGDGATLTTQGASRKAGIYIEPGNTLSIYCQSATTGTLVALGGYGAAGIGGDNAYSTTTGEISNCGKVNIYGGIITATGNGDAAGIGGGDGYGNGGTISVYGGSVTATAGSGSAAGIGKGWGSSAVNGTLTVGEKILVKAGASANPTTVLDHGANGEITLSAQRYFTLETTGPTPLAQTANAFAAYVGQAFNQALSATVSGGTSPYSFTLKTGTLPTGLSFENGTISGTPTVGGSATVVFTVSDSATGTDHQSADFTYTITVTQPPKSITYIDSRDGTTELTGLAPALYTPGTAATLPSTATAPTGYNFGGWYATAECTGDAVTAVPASETENKTYYAKWTPIVYTVTYMTDSTTQITDQGLVPTSYTIESADLTLPATATKAGYGFYGWYTDSACSGSAVTTIPSGSTGNKTFYAKWGEVKVSTPYVDAAGNAMPEQLCAVVTSETTTLNTGWYVVNDDVAINGTVTVSGNVNLILMDGKTLTVTSSAATAINVTGDNSLTIFGQSGCTGRLDATSSYLLSAAIGGNSSQIVGTITINGGVVNATASSGAGIGGGYGSAGGTVIINGGTVTAIGNGSGAGIGGGLSGAGGAVTVNGGAVTATGGYSSGVGSGSSGANHGTLTVGSKVVVKAGENVNPTTVLNPNGETVLTSQLSGQKYFTFETFVLAQAETELAAYAGEAFELSLADTITGGVPAYTFSGLTPDNLDLTLTSNGTLSGTLAAGVYNLTLTVTDAESTSINASYTLTVTAKPKSITYKDGDSTIEGLSPTQYTPGTVTALAASATKTGYTFVGWHDNAGLTGNAVTAVPAEATDNLTFWAEWTPTVYTVTYNDGDTPITDQGLTPTSYTIESATLTLPASATKTGRGFYGWYDNSGCTGSAVTTIPSGSTGNKTFWAKWGAVKVSANYVDAAGVSHSAECAQITADMTTLDNGWYVVNGDVTMDGYVTVSGSINLILADGANLVVPKPDQSKAGIQVAAGNSLTIYAQSAGTGRLEANGGSISAGIGGSYSQAGGTVTINGGTIVANGDSGAGIGGGYGQPCGTVIINGGNVTASGNNSGSGIGGGAGYATGTGGDVFVYGGTVTAIGGYSNAGVGGYTGSYQGTLTVGENVVVKAGANENPTTVLNPNGETVLTSSLNGQKYFTFETVGPTPLVQKTSALVAYVDEAASFDLATTVGGGTPDYTFALKAGTIPTGMEFAGSTISGTPAASGVATLVFTVTDSGTGADAQSEDFTYTLTVTPRPKTITYMDGAVELTGLVPAEYVEGTGATLPATATKTGYTFVGWYDNAGLAGDAVAAIGTEATGNQTFWAKWTAVEYTITYMDGSTTLTGLAPTSYTIEAAETLPTPGEKEGYTFAGWRDNAGLTGDEVTGIALGSTGNKTFYAKWTRNPGVPVEVTFVGADGSAQTETCVALTTDDTELTGWYVVDGDLNFGTSGLTVVGSAHVVLLNGSSLRVNGGSGKAGIEVSSGNSLSIYGEVGGTGTLTASGTFGTAGIGGTQDGTVGSITINGGTVVAEGGFRSAGIGGGNGRNGGTVTINGGTVTASGDNGSGIGGGYGAESQGTLTIGDYVTVTAGASENPTAEKTPDGNGAITLSGEQYYKVVCDRPVSVSYRDVDGTDKIAACKLVTADTTILDGDVSAWYAVTENVSISEIFTVTNSVKLILADGVTFSVTASSRAGIAVYEGNALTIYGQADGSGTLNATGGSSGGAGIGGYSDYASGSITINGGVVNATGGGNGAGIGGGSWANGGAVTINGGTVNATGGSSSAAGIGKGTYGSSHGSLTVGVGVRVKAGSSADPTTVLNPNGETSITLGGERYYVVARPALAQKGESQFAAYAGEAFEISLADTVEGGVSPYAFSGLTPDNLGLTLTSGGTLSGTLANGIYSLSATVTDSAATAITVSYTLTVSLRPKTITYMDGEDELTGLEPAEYVEGTGATLPATATKTGYTFAGWYGNPELTGEPVTTIGTEATGNQTFWAKWTAVEYTITYMDGSTTMTGLAPTSYTIEAAETLPTPGEKEGYIFAGWRDNAGLTGSEVTTIPAGSTGDRTFYGKWTRIPGVPMAVTFIDADRTERTETCYVITEEETELGNGWYAIDGTLNFGTGGITVSGDVHLVLRDGSSMTVTGDSSAYTPGIKVLPGYSLTIYGEAGCTGTLTANGGNFAAGIGGGMNDACGTVTINGGRVVATGGSNAAGIGGGWKNIGGGETSGNGGTVTINGGTVTANGGYACPGIGGGDGSSNHGTLTVSARVVVKAGSSENPIAVLDHGVNGAIALSGQRYFFIERIGPENLAQTVNAFAAQVGVAFNQSLAGTVSGGTSPYSFTLNTGTLPEGLAFNEGAISGTPTVSGSESVVFTVTDSGVGTDNQSADFTYTITVTYPTRSITYIDSRDGTTELTGLEPAQYDPGTAVALPATASAPNGYTFAGWYADSECTGEAVITIAATETVSKTFYAKWTPIVYTVTYMDGSTPITDQGLEPTSYTIESETLTLPAAATKTGKGFYGWYVDSACTGDAVMTIPHGSTGNKVFYAKWGAEQSNEAYVDAYGNAMPAQLCTVIASDTTTLATGWYVVKGEVLINTAVTVFGNVNLILADGAHLTVNLSATELYDAAINVTGENSLTIYSQALGTGALDATAGYLSAGIGGNFYTPACGTIIINGGTVTATTTSGGAGIGGGYSSNNYGSGTGGTITINGGTVTAIGQGAGIGGGSGTPAGASGSVTINGGTVTATGSSGAGIGGGSSTVDQGTLTVGAYVVVKAGTQSILTDSDIKNPNGETSIPLTTKYQYYQVNKVGPSPLVQETSALAAQVGVAFNQSLAGTVSGGISPYSFTLKSGNLPDGLSFNDGAISGTPTATASETVVITVGDSAIGYDHQSEDFTYTVTVTYPPKSITYIDSRDGTTELTGLEPVQYMPGTAATLPATATAPTGYEFAGWYTTAECTGEAVTTIAVTETEVKTFYAKWTPIVYTVTYMDGSTPITDQGLIPTSYTIESETLTLPGTATKAGKGFYGWYDNVACTGSAVTTIPQGSTGDKVFYAKWGAEQSNEAYVDAEGNAMPEQLCTVIASDTTTLATGWYIVKGEVAINATVTVSGSVNLILADGAHLTVDATGIYDAAINVTGENSLTIYSQNLGTGVLEATGGSISAAIGGGFSTPACGTITINGGTVTATAPSGGAGIGGGYDGGSEGLATGGTITINGGTVTAIGKAAGIGGGGGSTVAGAGGTVTINGGVVIATSGTALKPGIGGGSSTVGQGTLTVGANVVVKAGASSTLTDSDIKNPNGETSIPLTTIYQYYRVEKVGPSPLTQETSAFAAQIGVSFEQSITGTVSGGTAPYTFTLKSQTLSEKGLAYENGAISGTPSATGSATVTVTVSDSGTGSDHQSEDFTYTVTITYPPKSITYVDSRDGTTELTGLVPAQYTPGTAATLPATATAPTGYNFDGWYVDASCTGDAVTSVATTETEDKTYYAKWTPILYTITYRDGASTMSGLVPTTYTIESTDITIPTPATKTGYEFVSWHTSSLLTPASVVTTIPHGSTGNKTFYSKWSIAPINEPYKDGSGNTVYVDCTPIDSATTSLSAGWYVVRGTVAISSTVTVTGDVKLILADGCSLTVTGSSNSAGIRVIGDNSLTIYAQEIGTGSLTATVSGSTSDCAGIGGNSGETCGTVTIYGGNITASSNSQYGAGIGGGKNGSGGTVTIYGGTVTAQAQYTAANGAGIGSGGSNSSNANIGAGTVTIYGGTVTATSAYGGAGIGGGLYGSGGTVTIEGGVVTATAGNRTSSTANYPATGIGKGYGSISSYGKGNLYIGANMVALAGSSADPTAEQTRDQTTGSVTIGAYRYFVVKAAELEQTTSELAGFIGDPCEIDLAATVKGGSGTYTFAVKAGSELPAGFSMSGTTLSCDPVTVGGTFTLVVTDTTAPTPQTIDAEYTLAVTVPGYIDDDPTEPTTGVEVDCRTYDGKVRRRTCNQVESSDAVVTWENSWYYVTGDVTLSAGVTVNGKVSLVLADDATLTVTGGSSSVAGINVVIANSVTNSLTIYGQTKGNGSLTATAGGDNGAGIGGGNSQKGGKVNVYGGVINATGGYYGAGIGGGRSGAGGVVSVYGGMIEATAGDTTSTPKPLGIGRGYNNTSKGDFYVYNEDMTVKGGASATGSLTKLTPNATTRKVDVETYHYFIVTGPLPMSQRTVSLGTARTGELKSWTLATSTSTSYIQDGKPPYTFDPENSTIPEGFSLTSAGVLSGRPSSAGNYEFDIAVTDSNPSSTNFTFTLTVSDPNPITMSTGLDLDTRTKGQSYTKTLSASGGVPSLTYAVVDGTFPPGLNLGTGGYISGSTTTAGDYNFTVRVTDSALPANTADFEFHMFVKDVYSITYYDGENTLSLNPATYVQDAGVATLPTPVKEGYAFLSWHDNAGLYGAPVTSIPSTSTGPVELYSKWYVPVAGDIEVTFNGADGEQTETCTVITPSMAAYDSTIHYNNTSSNITLSSGWYVVANIDTLPEKVSIVINGEVNLVLMDDRSLTVTKPAYHKTSRYISPILLTSGNTLNIYGQTKGNGTLSTTGFSDTPGIGGCYVTNMRECGTLKVYGGTVIATGATGAAGIGGFAGSAALGNGGDGGTVEIYGGTVTATGSRGGAGIGGGDNYAGGYAGCGGTVKIYGGTVTAIGCGYSDRAGAGIGGGGSNASYPNIEDHGGRGGTVEIYNGNVTAIGGAVDDVHAAGIGAGSGIDDEGTLKVSGEYALVYAGANAESKTERTPDANDMVELDGSPYFEIQGEGAAPVTCNITYMSAGESQYWLEPNNYTQGTAQTLAEAPDPREGYTFEGWFDNDQFEGEEVTEIPASATGDKTFYAKWTAVAYTITYYSIVGDEKTELTGLEPATYTTESGATLPTEISVVREGWVFDGWANYTSGPQITQIAAATIGDKTFYARWDVADFGLFDGELDSPDAGEAGEWNLTDTIHKGTAPYTFALKEGSSLPDGLVLDADGTLHGTATAAGNYTFTLTVTDSSEPQKTIDAVYTMDVYFHKSTSSIYGEDARIPVGYQASVNLQVAISGGTAPYTFEVVEETPLTPGLRLQGNYLRGTPTVTGNSHFFLKVTDANDLSFYLYYWVYVYGDFISTTSMLRHTTVNGVEWTHVSATDSGSKSSRMTLWNDCQSAIPTNTVGQVFVPYKFSGGSYPPAYVCCVGAGAFSNCTELVRVTLPPYLAAIGENAFFGCSSLKEVAMLAPVEQIDAGAFAGTALETVYVRVGDADDIRSLLAASGCNTDGIAIVECEPCTLTLDPNLGTLDQNEFTVPANATVGGLPVPVRENYAFEGWFTAREGGDEVTEDTVISGDTTYYARWTSTLPPPEFTVNDAGELTAVNLNGNTEITLPDDVKSIGTWALRGNASILRVTIPDTVTNINTSAFNLCYNLESVQIPGSVEDIGNYAFMNCSNLVSVTIGEGVKTIGNSAFYNCVSLTTDNENGFYIPDSVTSIGSGAFHGVRFEKASLPGTLYSEGDPVSAQFSNVISLTKITVSYRDLTIPVFKIINGSLRSVQLNGNTEITIPDSVEEIYIDAFSGLSEMTSVTIPNTVTNILADAFEGCSGLTEIEIPDSVTRIRYPFRGCTGLKSLTVPDSVTDLDLWSCSNLVEVVVGSGVTEVAENAFSSCKSLERVTFNGNLTWINESAFWNCYALKEINFPDTLRYIGRFAFMSCTSLEEVTIPKFVTVERHAFSGCTSLKHAKVGVEASTKKALLAAPRRKLLGTAPETTTIGERAFSSCTKLEGVTLGSTVSDIGGGAFSGCPKLKSITVEDGNENYSSVNGLLLRGEGDLVSACGTAANINVPSGVTNILQGAFADYTTLTSVTLPSSLTTISAGAFSNATHLATATIPAVVDTIGQGAFYDTALKTVCVSSTSYVEALRTKINSSGYDTTGVTFVAPTASMEIDADWKTTNGLSEATDEQVAAAMITQDDNGLSKWQNYVLGQDAKKPVKFEGVQSTGDTTITIASTFSNEPRTGTGYTVKYKIDRVTEDGTVVEPGEEQATTAFGIDLEDITSTAFFKVKATLKSTTTEDEVPVETENTIGVLAITNAPATMILGVPFTSLSDDGSIAVADLVHTANLSDDTKLQAFDTDGKLNSWTLKDGVWTPDYISGQEEQTGDADTIKLDRGKGVWLTRVEADLDKPVYLIGAASSEPPEDTTLEVPEEGKMAWTMVAAPSVEPADVNDVAADGDIIRLPTAGAPKDFTKENGEWGYTEYFTDDNGWVRSRRVTNKSTIPAGQGFWYINKSTDPNKKINWTK